MPDIRKQVKDRVSLGWNMLVCGTLWIGFGVLDTLQPGSSLMPPWFNLFTGVIAVVYGFSLVRRNRPILRDEKALEREAARERDEREILMRLKAFRVAYGAMVTMCAIGITWTAVGSRFGFDPFSAMPWLWGAALLIPLGTYHLSYQVVSRDLVE